MSSDGAAKCRWAQPTLYQPGLAWTEAWNSPWTCQRDEDPRVMEDTQPCEDCPRREPRTDRVLTIARDQ